MSRTPHASESPSSKPPRQRNGERREGMEGRVVGHVGGAMRGDRRTRPRGPDDLAPADPIAAEDLWDALDAVADPLFIVDRHWRIRFLNLAAASAVSVDRASALGASFWQVHRPLATGGLHERLADAMRDRAPVYVEAYAPALGGWIVASAYPTPDGLLILQHTTDAPHAAEETRELLEAERLARGDAERARRDAEAAARAKSDFLATMSHELRTPINAITGYTQLLELGVAGPVTDAQRGYLSRLYASGRHLLGLVDDVLDLANIERGRMTIARERLNTGTVVAAALALITPDAAARSIRLVDEREGDGGLPFVGDEHRVRQILLNLLSNAVKFTPPGGIVAVGCDRVVHAGGDFVCISVRDTGIGIAPDQLSAIFEPFTQADASRTRTAGGTGLGLALSRRLARLLDGDLEVESRLGEGSTFTLLLPVAPESLGAERPTAPHRAATPRAVWMGPTLGELGARMRRGIEPLLESFVARLRNDATFGASRMLPRAQLEDHTLSMLGAMVQSLAVAEAHGGLEGELLRDGSAIQEQIAFQHGAQRFRLGWTDAQLAHESDVFDEEVLTLARRDTPPSDETSRALQVLERLLARVRQATERGWQHAKRFE